MELWWKARWTCLVLIRLVLYSHFDSEWLFSSFYAMSGMMYYNSLFSFPFLALYIWFSPTEMAKLQNFDWWICRSLNWTLECFHLFLCLLGPNVMSCCFSQSLWSWVRCLTIQFFCAPKSTRLWPLEWLEPSRTFWLRTWVHNLQISEFLATLTLMRSCGRNAGHFWRFCVPASQFCWAEYLNSW